MPRLWLVLSLLLLSCASQVTEKDGVSRENLGSVKDPEVGAPEPGMIPAGCETLLNQSQAWGYVPGQQWVPRDEAQLLEVARFFAEFRLVPQSASDHFRDFENGGPPPGPETQTCDVFLAQTFLQAVIDHRGWSKEGKMEAARHLLRFLLNQQALFLPLVHRSMSAQVYAGAVKRSLLPGSKPKAATLSAWIVKEVAALPPQAADGADELSSLRKQSALSAKIRDRLGALLPLP